MKPANTIFVAIAFSVLTDILIKVLIPDRVMKCSVHRHAFNRLTRRTSRGIRHGREEWLGRSIPPTG
jgi:hypothetical protein